MQRFIEIAGGLCILILVFLLGLICFPFVILWWPVRVFIEWSDKRKFTGYLRTLGNKNFLCYNNRKDAISFIENRLIPALDIGVELIYLNGINPESKYDERQISYALYHLRNYSQFPHLIKIRDGKLIDQSINNECFNIIQQNKPMDKLLLNIREFFKE